MVRVGSAVRSRAMAPVKTCIGKLSSFLLLFSFNARITNMKLLDKVLNKFSSDIAIDLGTANIRVFVKGDNKVIREPSVVAINTNTGKVLAVGNKAKKMIGRTPSYIVAVQPLKDGVISDFSATESMIHYFIEKANLLSFSSRFMGPRVVVGVPSLITEVEINAVMDSARSAGARKVYIVEEPIAAAIGANLPIEDARASMIVDIGGGTTDIAVISLGGIVVDNTINIAGDEMDLAIVEYIRNKYNLLIGIKMAEDLKINLGSALPKNKDESSEVKGQDLISGLPKKIDIRGNEIVEALNPTLNQILNGIRDAIEKSPPEMISDLITNGVVLSGGGALIDNLDKFLSGKLKVPVIVTNDPIYAVIRGIKKLIDEMDLLERLQVKDLILK